MLADAVRRLYRRRSRVDVYKIPRGQGALIIQTCFGLDEGGWTEIGPGKFLFSSPAQRNRTAGGLCQTRSFDRDLAGMLAAKSSAEIRNNDLGALIGKMKRACQFRAAT